MICPLCSGPRGEVFDQDKLRSYIKCEICKLVYVPRSSLIPADEEKKRYESHNNSEDDPGYIQYLRNISTQIEPYLPSKGLGLDFGCGETTLLAKLLKENAHEIDSYDLYFHPREDIWEKKYDFIIMSEVIEHLRVPMETMINLTRCLNPNGQIFIKTKLYPKNSELFKNWFYKRDITHVQFFSKEALEFLGKQLSLSGPNELGADMFRFTR